MIAASTINAMGGNIDDTNVSKTSAWRKAKQVRTETAAQVKNTFKCPAKVTAHWDGKGLDLVGNTKSNRICVYLAGADSEMERKLLGVPETPSGTGAAEAAVVTEMLTEWGVKDQVVGMVFDTTSSNTGKESGACKFIEELLQSPILWVACRHHIAELHKGKVFHAVFGTTTDPGVGMFRRLKKEWAGLQIDLDDLVIFDISLLDPNLQDVAKSVLEWAMEELEKKTWPREDYQELLELLIVTLGGKVEGFTFKMPGADHHARWMSKDIYILKIRLLSKIFRISVEELDKITQVTEFVVLFFVKYWL